MPVTLIAVLLLARTTVGFQQPTISDGARSALTVGIWYPSAEPVTRQPIGPFQQDVAANGALVGDALPLILISHGTGGSLASHFDTALALARAGFVVAAVTHTGDNYQDQTYAGNVIDLVDRPRQVIRVIDFMLTEWSEASKTRWRRSATTSVRDRTSSVNTPGGRGIHRAATSVARLS